MTRAPKSGSDVLKGPIMYIHGQVKPVRITEIFKGLVSQFPLAYTNDIKREVILVRDHPRTKKLLNMINL